MLELLSLVPIHFAIAAGNTRDAGTMGGEDGSLHAAAPGDG